MAFLHTRDLGGRFHVLAAFRRAVGRSAGFLIQVGSALAERGLRVFSRFPVRTGDAGTTGGHHLEARDLRACPPDSREPRHVGTNPLDRDLRSFRLEHRGSAGCSSAR